MLNPRRRRRNKSGPTIGPTIIPGTKRAGWRATPGNRHAMTGRIGHRETMGRRRRPDNFRRPGKTNPRRRAGVGRRSSGRIRRRQRRCCRWRGRRPIFLDNRRRRRHYRNGRCNFSDPLIISRSRRKFHNLGRISFSRRRRAGRTGCWNCLRRHHRWQRRIRRDRSRLQTTVFCNWNGRRNTSRQRSLFG